MKATTRTVLFGLAAALAACGENSVVAPKGAQTGVTVAGGGSSEALTSSDTVRFSITIDPARQTVYNLGAGNSIVFPAHSLCEPNRSTYGEGQWDKPCPVARAPLTLDVKGWLDKYGNPRVDFSQHVRFVPTDNPAGWVELTFSSLEASLDPMFNILYCPKDISSCYDESKRDPTLVTVRNPATGQVTRRIKHFSGYVVSADDCGDMCISSTNSLKPGFWVAALKRSGYMLASG